MFNVESDAWSFKIEDAPLFMSTVEEKNNSKQNSTVEKSTIQTKKVYTAEKTYNPKQNITSALCSTLSTHSLLTLMAVKSVAYCGVSYGLQCSCYIGVL